MLDEAGKRNFVNQMHQLWVEPELLRRRKAGTLPEGFKIVRLLIKLPKEKPAIVQFNEEIGWTAMVDPAPGILKGSGETVYLYEVREILNVEPPEENGQRVAFLYFFWNGTEHQLIFDFTPNWPKEAVEKDQAEEWELGKEIAKSLQAIITERVIHIHDEVQSLLKQIGLWAAPSLLPYPLSKIVKQLQDEDIDGAYASLIGHCTPDFIEGLTAKWWNVKQFEQRKGLILEATFAHRNAQYRLSVHALLPQIEGIITDWIYSSFPETDVPFRQESKTKKFRDLVLDTPPTTFTYRRVVDSTIDFIIGGPVLATFKHWLDQIDQSFPNRHVVQHGRYDETLFIEVDSIKLFLLLDTIYHIVSTRAVNNDELYE